MRNRLLISALLMLLLGKSFGQATFPSQETLQMFLQSKTYIVLEDAMFSQFNATIRDVAQKHWKITSYEVINLAKFETVCKNPQASFLMVVIGEYTGIGKQAKYNMLTLIMGHKSGGINKMPEIISVPLACLIDENSDADEEDYDYKLGGILEGMQYAVEHILPQKLNLTNLKTHLNAAANEVKTMELWLTKQDLSEHVNTIEKIQQIYPYKVVIAAPEAISEAIDSRKSGVAFVHKVGNSAVRNGLCIKAVISCADGKILYGDYHNVSAKEPVGLLPKDFENLK
ncbi:MAG: hypothetical protein FWH36_02415 [Lentimicrobiaceae bacterium]|nr:hypothetical protein [Lentimicrobiaceae bacterium]